MYLVFQIMGRYLKFLKLDLSVEIHCSGDVLSASTAKIFQNVFSRKNLYVLI